MEWDALREGEGWGRAMQGMRMPSTPGRRKLTLERGLALSLLTMISGVACLPVRQAWICAENCLHTALWQFAVRQWSHSGLRKVLEVNEGG